VHHFILKHIYGPMCKRGYSPALGNMTAFFVSAVLHEYVIMFGLFIPTYYFFLGMFVNSIAIIVEGPINKVIFEALKISIGILTSRILEMLCFGCNSVC
jgi:hypothetical protein